MASPPGELLVRRRYLRAIRDAAVDLWGLDGLARVAEALSPETRQATVDAVVLTVEWLPVRFVMNWFDAVWATTAQRDQALFAQFIDRQTELGFSRVRRFFLSYATPELALEKASSLWSDDNSGGALVVVEMKRDRATLDLRDHVYASTPLSRLAITELVRSVLSRCKVKQATAKGALTPEGWLRMYLGWTR